MRVLGWIVLTVGLLHYTSPAIYGVDGRDDDKEQEAGKKAFERGRYQESESLFRNDVVAQERAGIRDASLLAADWQNLATVYLAEGRHAEAEKLYRQALRVWEQTPGAEAAVAVVLNNFSALLRTLARYPEAEQAARRALQLQEHLHAPDTDEMSRTLHNLCELYAAQERYDEAEASCRRAIDVQGTISDANRSTLALLIGGLGGVYHAQGKYALAADYLQRALSATEQALGPAHPRVAVMLTNLSAVYSKQGKFKQAEPLLHRALRIWETSLGPNHPDLAAGFANLAAVEFGRHHYKEAVALNRRALRINEIALGGTHPVVGINLTNLGIALAETRQYREAEEILQRAIKLAQAPPAMQTFGTEALRNLGQVYRAENRLPEAADCYLRAIAAKEERLGANHPQLIADLNAYAHVMRSLQEYAAAEKAEVRALGIQVRNSLHP
jgi:tetratricopeptide (TPR) repeat protein